MGVAYGPVTAAADGLVLCLDAGNPKSYPGSGTIWYDLSPNKINGTLTSGPTFSGTNKGYFAFDGVDDYVSLGTSTILDSVLNGATNWTINCWIYIASGGYVFDCGNLGNDPSGALEFYGNSISVNNISSTLSMSASISTSTWYNTVLTKNSSRVHSWYLNGAFSNSATQVQDYSVSGQLWKIGRRAYNTSGIFAGRISYFSIYNRVLSDGEVQQNFNAVRGRYGL